MTPMRILLVDDDADCRTLMREAIEDCAAGQAVYEARNGREALNLLLEAPGEEAGLHPDLIFLDVEMPGMDGQETLRRIRSCPELRETPVVMMTGVSDGRQIRQAARNGANSYTVKPTGAAQFLQMMAVIVHYWLKVHRRPDV